MAPTANPRMHSPARRRTLSLPIAVLIALLALTLLGPAAAFAKGGGGGGGGGGDARPEVRVAGACGRGATSTLKLKARDGGIETEFEVHGRSGAKWRVAIVQEARIVWRGRARTLGASRSFSVERRLADYPGADHVTARAVGPRGITCQATAMLPG
jgi:hypothetical protein